MKPFCRGVYWHNWNPIYTLWHILDISTLNMRPNLSLISASPYHNVNITPMASGNRKICRPLHSTSLLRYHGASDDIMYCPRVAYFLVSFGMGCHVVDGVWVLPRPSHPTAMQSVKTLPTATKQIFFQVQRQLGLLDQAWCKSDLS